MPDRSSIIGQSEEEIPAYQEHFMNDHLKEQSASYHHPSNGTGTDYQTTGYRSPSLTGNSEYRSAGLSGNSEYRGTGLSGISEYGGTGLAGASEFRATGSGDYRGTGLSSSVEYRSPGLQSASEYRTSGINGNSEYRSSVVGGDYRVPGLDYQSPSVHESNASDYLAFQRNSDLFTSRGEDHNIFIFGPDLSRGHSKVYHTITAQGGGSRVGQNDIRDSGTTPNLLMVLWLFPISFSEGKCKKHPEVVVSRIPPELKTVK